MAAFKKYLFLRTASLLSIPGRNTLLRYTSILRVTSQRGLCPENKMYRLDVVYIRKSLENAENFLNLELSPIWGITKFPGKIRYFIISVPSYPDIRKIKIS
jgi:hypothetical protein